MNNQTRVIQREKLRLHTSSKHKETTISHKRMHQKHVENLKSQLKDYKVDPSEDSSSIGISADQEISFSVLLGLLQSSELGNKMHLSFVKKRLVEGEKSIFEPISKSNIKTSNEKKKLQKNDFRSEGRQTGISCYCNKTKWFTWSFSYPITSLPLSIAFPDSSLYQSDKAGSRNYIMKSSNSVSSSFPQIPKWINDGMAAMHSLKPRSTYMEWFIDSLKYITSPAKVNAHSWDIIMDIYIPRSVKEGTRW